MSGQGGVMARLQRLDEGHSHCGWGVGDGRYHLDVSLLVKRHLHQLRLVAYPTLFAGFLCIPGGEPSKEGIWNRDHIVKRCKFIGKVVIF